MLAPCALRKKSTHRFTTVFKLPGGARRASFSCRLNMRQFVGDFRRARRRFFHLQQRMPPRMPRLRLAQQQRRVAEHARQRVVEIQRHRPRQLQRAIQFLLERRVACVRRAVTSAAASAAGRRPARCGTASGSNCSTNHLLAFRAEGADRRGEFHRRAARDAEFQIRRHGRRLLPAREKILRRRRRFPATRWPTAAAIRRPAPRQTCSRPPCWRAAPRCRRSPATPARPHSPDQIQLQASFKFKPASIPAYRCFRKISRK